MAGGKPGAVAKGVQISGNRERLLRKEIFVARRGDRLQPSLPGGGGFGPPWERDAARVLDDVINEKVSLEAAAREYGVAIDATTMTVNVEKTAALRRQMAPADASEERERA